MNEPIPRPVQIKPVQILLVEDSPGDVSLTRAALADSRIANDLHVVGDGDLALEFLRAPGDSASPRPDLVLLDLNLPRTDGREVLRQMKEDPLLRRIPVIVLTSSADEADVLKSYDLHANSYVTKPIDFEEFLSAVRTIEDFWLSIVRLPPA